MHSYYVAIRFSLERILAIFSHINLLQKILQIPRRNPTESKTVISFKAETGFYYSLYARCLPICLQWVNEYNLFLNFLSNNMVK